MNGLSEKQKRVSIGLFQWCIPHYRKGIFKKLQSRNNVEITVCASENLKASHLKTNHIDYEFPFKNISTWQIKIPIIKKTLTLQPYAIFCGLTKKHDVVIMPNDFFDVGVWFNLIVGRLFGIKVCLWGHGTITRYSLFTKILRGGIMKLAHAVIFYTDGPKDKWLAHGVPKEKMFVAYNALDTDLSQTLQEDNTPEILKSFKSELGLEGRQIVIFCGRLMARKQVDVLIHAINQAKASMPNIHALIIGDGPEKSELQALVASEKLDEYITFVGPIHDERLLAKYMLISKLSVIPGNAGLAVQHAFSYKLPIITNDNFSKQTPEIELVSNNVNGILCNEGDSEEFASKIVEVLSDDVFQQELSRNAYSAIINKYNIDNMAKGFFDAISYCYEKKTNN